SFLYSYLCSLSTSFSTTYPLSLHDALPIYLISLLCVAILAGGAVYLYLTPTTLAVEDKKVNQDELAKVHSLYQEIQENYYKEVRSEEHTSELQSRFDLVCRLLLEKKNNTRI